MSLSKIKISQKEITHGYCMVVGGWCDPLNLKKTNETITAEKYCQQIVENYMKNNQHWSTEGAHSCYTTTPDHTRVSQIGPQKLDESNI